MIYPDKFDVIVIGGGHAGTEAALSSSRQGSKTLLLTNNIDTLGQMSCNPSIGGIGKGHLVKEIDALGGIMALAADYAGIHFRILNSSKGPAVRSTRAQTDRLLYRSYIRKVLENQNNLWVIQQLVDDIVIKNESVVGVRTQLGVLFNSKSVILTAGTFLNGLMHIGDNRIHGGRAGDSSVILLANKFKDIGFSVGRLKTGTPPRIDGRTINYERLQIQHGDTNPIPCFSFINDESIHPTQLPCWITRTNSVSHEIVRNAFDRSPLYNGSIEGVGPRYCPSIEDKVFRFSDKESHQVFLEPEGLNTNEIYPNGISTSLPFDVQIDLVHSLDGLENAHILRPGYSIEYDFFDPKCLKSTLETKYISGLFFAGQVNGTTGYEEAAAQGLIAGLNASRYSRGESQWSPKRSDAYIGVMIDDLITIGVSEPYRMFTSRAEYRLLLREDNADLRLTEIGRSFGLIDDIRWGMFNKKRDLIEKELNRLRSTYLNPRFLLNVFSDSSVGKNLDREYRVFDILKRPGIDYMHLMQVKKDNGDYLVGPGLKDNKLISEQIDINIKYDGYVLRQMDEVKRFSDYENQLIPNNIDYDNLKNLSIEARQKLKEYKPETIGQASRVSGVTPAAISVLLIYIKSLRNKK
ncbi:glucose inhibited division protein A [Candidatus Kinetoplastibacterium desouzaii TCC079E]|uniref:tRNA uridine 5-carboxymethylaminomethyl modification enzyme MnmG n=1 Tax=Candidatus Kinetoplastidibacterium desouzai TCC079E TaxID=1208919 RepID=M1LVM4_9PROT|nr:tRNA uridine-5-carboxymethylaminomethyl(34) synthesis enzyme MnmG [Candidatus Kinetoplastibacterium desouzaii]AGF47299.1 glucose inhibited division protein A [Candidatus Kinetoplastibacterium desouzaii TCC079E]